MRKVLSRWSEGSSYGREVRAMFQVSINICGFCIFSANRDEELSSCSQFNLFQPASSNASRDDGMSPCLLIQLSFPLIQGVKCGLEKLLLPAVHPLLTVPNKGLLILPIKILSWRTVPFWVWICSHRHPFSASSYTHLIFIILPSFLTYCGSVRKKYVFNHLVNI